MVLVWGVVCAFGGGVSWCPLVQRCAGVRGFRTCHRLALVLWWCAPCLLSALLHCACRVACKYGSISRFKGVLRGFYGADVCLYGFGALRGLCGFCAREVFGGLEACGVFASLLPLFCPLLSSFLSSLMSFCSCVCLSFCPLCSCFYLFSCFPRLVLLAAWLLILVLSSLFVGCCCFFFPCGCMRKKKGRKVLFFASSLGVLFSRSNSCNVVKKLRCRCFGFFQFVRFILPANTTGVGRLAGSHLNPFRHNVNITDNPPAFLK